MSATNVIDWPSTLPVPLIVRTHRAETRNLVTEMESGRIRVRRRQDAESEFIDVNWSFTVDEFEAFKDFYTDDLENGEGCFEIVTYDPNSNPNLTTEYTRVVMFTGNPQFSRSDNNFIVSGTLYIISETVTEGGETEILVSYDPDPDDPSPPTDIEEQCRHTLLLSWSYLAGDVIESATSDSASNANWYEYLTPDLTAEEIAAGTAEISINNDFDHDETHEYITWYSNLTIGSLPASHNPGVSPDVTDGLAAVSGSTTLSVRTFHWETGTMTGNVTESTGDGKAALWAGLRAALTEVVGSPTEEQARSIKDWIAAIVGKSRWFRITRNGTVRSSSVRARASKIAAPKLTVAQTYTQHSTWSAISAGSLNASASGSPFYQPFSYRENLYLQPEDYYVEPRERLEYLRGFNADETSLQGYPHDRTPGFMGDTYAHDGNATTVDYLSPESGVEIRWTTNNSDPVLAQAWPPLEYEGAEFNARVYHESWPGVLNARCFKDGCKSPQAKLVIDKRIRLIGSGLVLALKGDSISAAGGNGVQDDIVQFGCSNLSDAGSGNSTDPLRRWAFTSKDQNAFSVYRFLFYDYFTYLLADSGGRWTGMPGTFYEYLSIVAFDFNDPGEGEPYSFNNGTLTRSAFIEIKDPTEDGIAGAEDATPHKSTITAFMASRVPTCLPQTRNRDLLINVDLRLSVYGPDGDTIDAGDYDPFTDAPETPVDDEIYYELWEEYTDTVDATALTLDGGTGWSTDTGSEAWVLIQYAGQGYDLWEEGYSDVELEDSALTAPEDTPVWYGEGWDAESGWTLHDYESDYGSELWEDADYSDEVLSESSVLNKGESWADDEVNSAVLTPWSLIDYELRNYGSELWEDYSDESDPIAQTLDEGVNWFADSEWALLDYE